MKYVLISYATSGHSGRTVLLKFSAVLARTVLKLITFRRDCRHLTINGLCGPFVLTFKMAV